MEKNIFKQQKEVEELRVDNVNAYQAKNEVQRHANQRHAQMVFNEKLNELLEKNQKKKPFNYDIAFIKNNEFKKHNILLHVKLKALSM